MTSKRFKQVIIVQPVYDDYPSVFVGMSTLFYEDWIKTKMHLEVLSSGMSGKILKLAHHLMLAEGADAVITEEHVGLALPHLHPLGYYSKATGVTLLVWIADDIDQRMQDAGAIGTVVRPPLWDYINGPLDVGDDPRFRNSLVMKAGHGGEREAAFAEAAAWMCSKKRYLGDLHGKLEHAIEQGNQADVELVKAMIIEQENSEHYVPPDQSKVLHPDENFPK